MTNTVAKEAVMKTSVATTDLGENLAIPHTPCPLVHPDPKVTPMPTVTFFVTPSCHRFSLKHFMGKITNPIASWNHPRGKCLEAK